MSNPILILARRNLTTLSGSESLRAWTVFAKSGRFKSELTKTVRAGCPDCQPMDLGPIVTLINSPSTSWITHLSLETVQLTTSELMRIADISNLRTLYIRASSERMPLPLNQVIRAWSALAKERNAFKILKTLFLDMGSERNFSPWMFHHMNGFPALDMVAVRAPRLWVTTAQSEAKRCGWHDSQWYGRLVPTILHH